MKKVIMLAITLLLSTGAILAQSSFSALKTRAGDAYSAKSYAESGKLYDQAFAQRPAQSSATDFYNAACSWAQAGNATKAFQYLDRATGAGWENVAHAKQDGDLMSLHADKRWQPMLSKLEAAVARIEASYDQPLKKELDAIYASDQGSRQGYEAIAKQYGTDSPEMRALWKQMQLTDSLNLRKITALIDSRGWPTKAQVGGMGTQTVFLVVQHSNLPTMQKYFPMAQQAAARGDLAKSALALMQDRLLMWQGKPQMYGSQLTQDNKTNKMVFHPIEDEAHVDERRAAIGMEPLASYAKRFGLDYSVPKK
ncbi:DUF6624 domain-containing protein [Hymenobacter lapidiphilus]|uniref:Tetratricopeptide repeat protein n=1 Tax=Hymenobacter lapidiphilus TaxID=2608003 RepID=A0A7Y7U6N3_9BACT|nr:DUF6624 domain-containing protein [Hymenobacter lapidiphilus]NVO32592.1 hypothetical protein [Hymenobacter lapidiphilus]